MNTKRFVFLDLDDCVFPRSGGGMLPEDINYLQKYVMEANVGRQPQIKLCTGRNVSFVSGLLYSLFGKPIGSGFHVLENGSVFYSADTKQRPMINPQVSRRALHQLKVARVKIVPKIEEKCPALWAYDGNRVNITLVKENGSNLSLVAAKKMVRSEILSVGKKLAEKKGPRKKVGARSIIPNWLKPKRRIRMPAISVVSYGQGVAVIPRGIDKGTAVEKLAEIEGFDLRDCIGIGDASSDVSFLRRIRFVGCPSNADTACRDFVKKARGEVSNRSYLSGVVDVIHFFTQFKVAYPRDEESG